MRAVKAVMQLGDNANSLLMGVAVLAALGAVAYLVFRGPAGVAGDAGKTVGKSVGNAAMGFVHGVGETVGIPEVDESECDKAIREGRRFDASLYCPAGKFIGSIFTSDAQKVADAATVPGSAF